MMPVKKTSFYFIFFLLGPLLLGLGPTALASSVAEESLEEITRGSELIFEGKVVSHWSRWSDDRASIQSDIIFEISDENGILKGDVSGTEVECPQNKNKTCIQLSFQGGCIESLCLEISDMKIPVKGGEVILFVEDKSSQQVNPIRGWHQGHFLLVKHPEKTKEKIVLTADARPVKSYQTPQKKKPSISRGAAAGIKTTFSPKGAVTKQAFKKKIQELVLLTSFDPSKAQLSKSKMNHRNYTGSK